MIHPVTAVLLALAVLMAAVWDSPAWVLVALAAVGVQIDDWLERRNS